MEFVTFEIAKKLKEKGFDKECLCHYIGNDLVYNIESPIAHNQMWFSHNKFDNIWHRDNYDAPTISQVLKWLREKKKIFLHIDVYENDKFDYFFGIAVQGDETWERRYVGEKDYKTYEQAALAGIEYALDNLI